MKLRIKISSQGRGNSLPLRLPLAKEPTMILLLARTTPIQVRPPAVPAQMDTGAPSSPIPKKSAVNSLNSPLTFFLPISTQTLKAGVERIIMDRVPGVTEVVAD